MLVNPVTLMATARREGYALGSFDQLSIETVRGTLAAAEAARSPLVLAISATHMETVDFGALAPALVALAGRAEIPLALHLDHATTLGQVARALALGFNSIMYDGAGQDWATHLAELRVVTEMTHDLGGAVEAALSDQSREQTDNPTGTWELPSPELAEEFVAATGVDVLAIGEGRSTFDLARVKALSSLGGALPALHGGSKLSDAEVRELIDAGVVKFSVFSKIARRAVDEVRAALGDDGLDLLAFGSSISAGYAAGVAAEIARFGSADLV